MTNAFPSAPTLPLAAPASRGIADGALRLSVRLWFLVAVGGQWMFACYIAVFYGGAALRGDWTAWNNILPHGYVAGNTVGNVALGMHLLFAASISFMGALQLVPQIRAQAPRVHRWLGRTYVLLALFMGTTALYLSSSGRKVVGDLSQRIASDTNALLILLCAVLAWRCALTRDFNAHRRWAMRLFLVVNGVWFFRLELMCWLAINQRPVGFDPDSFTGPFLTIAGFAQFLLPLAMLEIYLRVTRDGGPRARIATSAALAILTLAMGTGIVAATEGMCCHTFDMSISPLLLFHICAGVLGFSAGLGAMLFKKGSALHRTAGNVFAGSMLVMCVAGAYMATFVHPALVNVMAAVLTFYWVSSGWLAARQPQPNKSALTFLMLLAIAAGIAGLMLGHRASVSPNGMLTGDPAEPYIVFATLALLSAALDLRVLVRGLVGKHRIARHLWRMCLAFLVTTTSLFVGNPGNSLLPGFIFRTALANIPPLLLLGAMIYWLIRVLRNRVSRRLSAT